MIKYRIISPICSYGYSLTNLLIKVSKVLWYNVLLQYSPFAVFVWSSTLFICVTYVPDSTALYMYMTGYTLDCTAGAWPHQGNLALPGNLSTHLGFPRMSVFSWVWHLFFVLYVCTGCFKIYVTLLNKSQFFKNQMSLITFTRDKT